MNNQTITQPNRMTIQQFMAEHGKSYSTVQRWIKDGKLNAEKIDGCWYIYPEPIPEQPNAATTIQHDQSTDQPPDQSSNGQLEQLQSENEHLREVLLRRDQELMRRGDEVDKLTTLVAVAAKKEEALIAKLPPPEQPDPKPRFSFMRLFHQLKSP